MEWIAILGIVVVLGLSGWTFSKRAAAQRKRRAAMERRIEQHERDMRQAAIDEDRRVNDLQRRWEDDFERREREARAHADIVDFERYGPGGKREAPFRRAGPPTPRS